MERQLTAPFAENQPADGTELCRFAFNIILINLTILAGCQACGACPTDILAVNVDFEPRKRSCRVNSLHC